MLAVLITLVATFFIQCGYFLWKISADDDQPKIGKASTLIVLRALVTDWRFVLGFIATTAGWILFVQATSLGDISLVQPLMSAGEFLIVLLAVIFLKERLDKKEQIGVFLSILGSVALVWNIEEASVSHFDMTQLFLFISCIVTLGILLAFFSHRSKQSEIFLAIIVGLCFGAGALFTKAMTSTFASGIDWSILFNPFLPAVIITNVLGLILLQTAFQRGRASIIVPVQVAITNVLTVCAGMIIFSEHITLSRAVGITMILLATFLIQTKKK
ncbi:MAG: EamA family transporter [Candidatus Moranbacteria bacterium]|nr:EamA family transporter [Candidatus Moranbacteria bacterium]MDD3964562.1 EamA family transporter [Candidatus Moranbacteria bacterium]